MGRRIVRAGLRLGFLKRPTKLRRFKVRRRRRFGVKRGTGQSGDISRVSYGKLRTSRRLSNRRRVKILNSLEPVRFNSTQSAEQFTGPTPGPLTGLSCSYFVSNNGGFTNGLYHVRDQLKIADSIVAGVDTENAPPHNHRFIFLQQVQSFKFVNCTNAQVNLIAYTVRLKRDLPNLEGYIDIKQVLGDGFLQNGIGTLQGVANQHMTRLESTPYQSSLFCSYFKIVRTQKLLFEPGQTQEIQHSILKPMMAYPGRIIDPGSLVPSYLGSSRVLAHVAGAQFMLFKMYGQIANGSGLSSSLLTSTIPRLDCLTLTRLHYKKLINTTPHYAIDDPATFAGGAATIMLEDADVKATSGFAD